MSRGVQEGFLNFWWYAHLYDFLLFANYLPYSKHSHVLSVAPNILFRRIEPTGKLQPIKDFENLERFGAGQIEDLTWKQMLDPVHLHRVRALRDQLPRVPHRQGALAEEDHARHARRHRGGSAQDQLAHLRLGRAQAALEERNGAQAPRLQWQRSERPPRRPHAHRCRRLQPRLGLRHLRRLHGAVPRVHRARPRAPGHAPLLHHERSQHARDRRRDAAADRTARPPLARRAVQPHRVDGRPRYPHLRRHAEVSLLGRLLRRDGRPQHPDHARRRAPAGRGRRQLRLPRR